MNYKQKNKLREQVLNNWKAFAKGLYQEWQRDGISNDEVRLTALAILTNHIAAKSVERLRRKVRKVKKIKAANMEEFAFEIKPEIHAEKNS